MSVVEERTETTVQPVTRRDVLHRAADLLEEFGWEQGSMLFGPPTHERTCLLGAVARARMDFGESCSTNPYRFGWEPIADLFVDHDAVWEWNDEPERTKAEVVAKLREAAEAS